MMTINIEPKDHQHALRILAAIYGEEERPLYGEEVSFPKKTKSAKDILRILKAPSGVQIEDLRSIVSLKVVDHRDVIKAELTRLKAKNVSTLDPSLFEEFKRFLEEL